MSEENKKIILTSEHKSKPSFIEQIIRLVIAVAIVTIVIILAWYFVKKIIWWLFAIASLILLGINYKLIGKILSWIKQQYNKNAIWGVLVTMASVVALGSGVFIGFLLLKTILDFAKSNKIQAIEENNNSTKNID